MFRMSKTITNQERIIQEMQQFISDALSEIFYTVEKHNPRILDLRRDYMMPVDLSSQKEAFGLY